jgi:hypothetical protein
MHYLKYMKIGIIGTHGVGKTTICKFLSFYFGQSSTNSDILIEVVRPLALEGLPFHEQTNFEAQEAVQNYQKVKEAIAEERMKKEEIRHAIFDRTVIDNYIYAEHAHPKSSKQRLFKPMLEWLKYHPYDKIFLVPLWNKKENMTDDKFRSMDKKFQEDIDKKIRIILEKLKIKYHVIPEKLFREEPELQMVTLKNFFDEKLRMNN